MSALRRAEAWVFAPGDPRRLAVLRIGLCGTLAVRSSRGVLLELAGQPEALFRPISFMHLLDAMPSRAVVAPLRAAAVALALAAAMGLASRVTLPLAWATGAFLAGMTTSLGKVAHNDVLLLLALVPLLAARSGDAWSLDAFLARRRGRSPVGPLERYGWPVRTAMLVVVGAYFFTGLAKVVASGPGWVTSESMRWIMYAASDAGAEPNRLALWIADRPWAARVTAAGVLGVELAFPLALRRAAWAAGFAVAAVGLHIGTWLTLGLDYWAWVATVLVVLVNWPALADRVRPARSREPERGRPAYASPR